MVVEGDGNRKEREVVGRVGSSTDKKSKSNSKKKKKKRKDL